MWNWARDLTKSAEERRAERITAYVDGQMPPADLARFEAELAADAALRERVEALRLLKLQLRRLPAQRAPRNFTLDPARYGKPAPAVGRAYPALRLATALTALLFVFAAVFSLRSAGNQAPGAVALAPTSAEVAPDSAVTRLYDEPAAALMIEETVEAADARLAPPPIAAAVAVTETVGVTQTEAATLMAAEAVTETFAISAVASVTETAGVTETEVAAFVVLEATDDAAAAATLKDAPAPEPAPRVAPAVWLLIGLGVLTALLLAAALLARQRGW